jgi:hypothetical protein
MKFFFLQVVLQYEQYIPHRQVICVPSFAQNLVLEVLKGLPVSRDFEVFFVSFDRS